MILIVGEDEVFAAALTREFGPKKAVHKASVEEAAQILTEEDVSMLVLVGEAKAFRKLKKHLHGERPTFLIHATDADAVEVMAG